MVHQGLCGRGFYPTRFGGRAMLLFAAIILTACAGGRDPEVPPEPVVQENAAASVEGAQNAAVKPIAIGDRLKIIIDGQSDLSGQVIVAPNGIIGHPRIGEIKVVNLMSDQVSRIIAQRLVQAGALNPVVSIERLDLRPIYVIGEVQKAGEYAFESGLKIADIISKAGGYTYRADERRVFVTRSAEPEEIELSTGMATPVNPGDIIRVPQRYF